MAKVLSVRGRDAFATLSRQGRRVREGPVTVIRLATDEPARVGFAVGRKVGPAVARNRLRRRLRALWRELAPPTGDHLVVATPAAAQLTYTELGDRLRAALQRLEAR